MANRAIWSMRLRHEWLKTPLKKARLKKSQRIRVGLEDALQRKAKPAEQPKGTCRALVPVRFRTAARRRRHPRRARERAVRRGHSFVRSLRSAGEIRPRC